MTKPMELLSQPSKGKNTYSEAAHNIWNTRMSSVVFDMHLVVAVALRMVSLGVWFFFVTNIVAYSGADSVKGSKRCGPCCG